ncbi:histidinol-phosphatase [Parerythrobacter jejuensis]|uniref:Histidinol-phosphatase n=1 Tax=Parerythrobacter jejuensis TaxID=795812 RepID=A0A845AWL6_9SPHN|nr:histidinol-phosphatase [Parerythrobacter jejuensis]MXP30795.1 histidinol-phosphatase [Parerythrobacter jejuensis]MXP33555.1 histidinol-phosphatase [Parerythrobacter jejuensis]
MNLTDQIAIANRLADAARDAIRPHYRTVTAERKSDASPVTIADRAAEEEMRRILKAEAARDGVIGEEFGEEEGETGRQWVLDPIDGTTGFLAGRPIFGTLIALVDRGFPVLGVIDQPILGERWIGVTGQGTTLNGTPVSTRVCKEMQDATLATTGPHYFSPEDGQRFMNLAGATDHQRMVMGGDCYNYAMLASGHLDMVVEAGLKLHDFAALVPVVEGAGGVMSDWNGDPLHAGSGGHVIALGDAARLEDVVDALQ